MCVLSVQVKEGEYIAMFRSLHCDTLSFLSFFFKVFV